MTMASKNGRLMKIIEGIIYETFRFRYLQFLGFEGLGPIEKARSPKKKLIPKI